jgi:hypothetical protein
LFEALDLSDFFSFLETVLLLENGERKISTSREKKPKKLKVKIKYKDLKNKFDMKFILFINLYISRMISSMSKFLSEVY